MFLVVSKIHNEIQDAFRLSFTQFGADYTRTNEKLDSLGVQLVHRYSGASSEDFWPSIQAPVPDGSSPLFRTPGCTRLMKLNCKVQSWLMMEDSPRKTYLSLRLVSTFLSLNGVAYRQIASRSCTCQQKVQVKLRSENKASVKALGEKQCRGKKKKGSN